MNSLFPLAAAALLTLLAVVPASAAPPDWRSLCAGRGNPNHKHGEDLTPYLCLPFARGAQRADAAFVTGSWTVRYKADRADGGTFSHLSFEDDGWMHGVLMPKTILSSGTWRSSSRMEFEFSPQGVMRYQDAVVSGLDRSDQRRWPAYKNYLKGDRMTGTWGFGPKYGVKPGFMWMEEPRWQAEPVEAYRSGDDLILFVHGHYLVTAYRLTRKR